MIILAIVTVILIILVAIMIWCKISIELDKKKGIQFKSKDLIYIDGFEDIDKLIETEILLHFKDFNLNFKNLEVTKALDVLNVRDMKIYEEKEDFLNDIKYKKIKTNNKITEDMLVKNKQFVMKVLDEKKERNLIFSSSFPELIKGTLERAIEQEKEYVRSKNNNVIEK